MLRHSFMRLMAHEGLKVALVGTSSSSFGRVALIGDDGRQGEMIQALCLMQGAHVIQGGVNLRLFGEIDHIQVPRERSVERALP